MDHTKHPTGATKLQPPKEPSPLPPKEPTLSPPPPIQPPTLSVKDVLSLLGQMDMDLTQQIAAKRGIARIREVMTAFEAASRAMTAMEETKVALTKDIAALNTKFRDEQTKAKQTRDTECAACAKEVEDAKGRAATAMKKLKAIDDELVEKERFAQGRAAQLDKDLLAKSAEFARITAAVEKLKQQIGLAS